MPEAKFILKEPESKEPTLVYLFFNFNYTRLKYSTGEKILPKYWNAADQRAKQTKDFPHYAEFNAKLRDLDYRVNSYYRTLVNDGEEPTPERLRDLLNGKAAKKQAEKRFTLLEFIEKYHEEGKLIKKPSTVKTYGTFKNNLDKFIEHRKKTIDFEDITLELYSELIGYLTNQLKLRPNTIGGFIKNLKATLNEATERGINTNTEFRKRKFSKPKESSEQIYLTPAEINSIYTLDLSETPKYERVRDLFIIGCYTGLRFSDYDQIEQSNIVDGNKLKIKAIKTNQLSIIPLHPRVLEILQKYNYWLPKSLTNQKMNEYLKKIGEKAKINETVSISTIQGRDKTVKAVPKHQLISTHCARRSFATNAYKAGVPTIKIMKITGHTQEKTFLQYIRISQEENANNLLDHPFFN